MATRLPTVYLDQAQLSDAFAGVDGLAPTPEQRELGAWVSRLAGRSLLAVSTIHLLEAIPLDRPKALAMADWLEGLPLVWCDYTDMVRDEEAAEALAFIMDPVRGYKYSPFYASLADLIQRISPEAASEIRGKPLRLALSAMIDRLQGSLEDMRRVSLETTRRLAEDRDLARRSESRKETDAFLDRRALGAQRMHFRDVARQPWFRDNSHYWPTRREGLPRPPTRQRVARAIGVALHFPRLRPFAFVHRGFWYAYSWDLDPRANPTSKNFRKRSQGAVADALHARTGASYADVFTCDRRTSAYIGPSREQLGKMPALSAGPALVKRLEEQLESLL